MTNTEKHYRDLYLAYATEYDGQLEQVARLMNLSGVIAEMLSETLEAIDKHGRSEVLQKKLERVWLIEQETKYFDYILNENTRLKLQLKQVMREKIQAEREKAELAEKLTVVEKTFADL